MLTDYHKRRVISFYHGGDDEVLTIDMGKFYLCYCKISITLQTPVRDIRKIMCYLLSKDNHHPYKYVDLEWSITEDELNQASNPADKLVKLSTGYIESELSRRGRNENF